MPTTHTPPAPDSDLIEQSGNSTPAPATASIPAFKFPFAPAAFAPNKADTQPWHQKSNKSNHDKTPGRAPNGTRRSMGKR